MDAAITYLSENWPSGIWLIVGLIIMRLYYQVMNKANNAYKKASETYDKIYRLPCDSHGEKITSIEVMNAKLDGIVQILQSTVTQKNPVIIAQSPIKLTDFGKQIVEELGIVSYINKQWEIISIQIDKNATSMNLYDIQQSCFNYVYSAPEQILTQEGYDKLKSKAFSIGSPVFNLLQAVAIVIRNRYFEEHGLSIEAVDDFVPTPG